MEGDVRVSGDTSYTWSDIVIVAIDTRKCDQQYKRYIPN